jgi:hypothetical protein
MRHVDAGGVRSCADYAGLCLDLHGDVSTARYCPCACLRLRTCGGNTGGAGEHCALFSDYCFRKPKVVEGEVFAMVRLRRLKQGA